MNVGRTAWSIRVREHAGALRGIYDDILSITSIDENGCEIVNNVEI